MSASASAVRQRAPPGAGGVDGSVGDGDASAAGGDASSSPAAPAAAAAAPAPPSAPSASVAELLATRDRIITARLHAQRLRRRAWWAALAAVALVAAAAAFFVPRLRLTLALWAGAAALLYLRAAYLPMPQGLRGAGTPFGGLTSLARLLTGGPAPAPRARGAGGGAGVKRA